MKKFAKAGMKKIFPCIMFLSFFTGIAATVSSAFDIPKEAWSRKIGFPFENEGVHRDAGSSAILLSSLVSPVVLDGNMRGAPVGGFGAGSIGRSYDGGFRQWHLLIGSHIYELADANQFSVRVKSEDEINGYSTVLFTGRPKNKKQLSAWKWEYPIGAGDYYSLFPKSYFAYDNDKIPVRLQCKQFSPIIPNNYKEVSYPVAVYEWEAENTTDKNVEVSVMLTWTNMTGWRVKKRGAAWLKNSKGNYNYKKEDPSAAGVIMTSGHDVDAPMTGEMVIAAKKIPQVEVTYTSSFDAKSNGKLLWDDFTGNGLLSDVDERITAGAGDILGGAVCVKVSLKPKQKIAFPFAVAWDYPVFEFGAGTKWYKYYTKFFGKSGHNGWAIAKEALKNYQKWDKEIDAWQKPILQDNRKPDWYKTALFNELYYLLDGGTAWENGLVEGQNKYDDPKDNKFSYLESYDYPFYSTYDVRFYGSFALLKLWPLIERQEILTLSDVVYTDDPNKPPHLDGAAPHDVGWPDGDPWFEVNAYGKHTVNWKDLNSKFVLMIYRDYALTGKKDKALLKYAWMPVKKTLARLWDMDKDGDGLPDNEGADQTYDTWAMHGTSAYCGGLLLAALEAAQEIGKILGDKQAAADFKAWFEKAQLEFEKQLWNGTYYNYDTKSEKTHDSIMADMLAGEWYAKICGLPDIVPQEHILSSLETIFKTNVLGVQNGLRGAMNGMRPGGGIDASSDQSQEVWTGVTYALASFMMLEGLTDEGLKTARGVYYTTYVDKGYWFRTPEAWFENGNYRAQMYMRPQSIWAMEYAPWQ